MGQRVGGYDMGTWDRGGGYDMGMLGIMYLDLGCIVTEARL